MKKIFDFLYDWSVNLYVGPIAPLPDSSHYDFAIPSEYCMCRDGTLPEATVRCLQQAQCVVDGDYILWGCTEYLGPGAETINSLKKKIIPDPLHTVVSNNTIEEARQLIAFLNSGSKVRLIVFCDKPHLPRLRLIYLYFIKDTKIYISFCPVEAKWDKPHYSRIQSNRWTWLAANVAHHVLLKLRGVEAMAKLRQ